MPVKTKVRKKKKKKKKKEKEKTNEKVWIVNKLYLCLSVSSSEQLRVPSSANKVP